MSFSTTIDIQVFINRAVEMLLANNILRDSGTPTDSLVSGVIAQEPPIEQSPNLTVIPVIIVGNSRNTFRRTDQFGRDGLDAAGAKMYHIEFYNICIARGISKEEAQKKVQTISQVVRDVFQKNLRMTEPVGNTDPLCSTNEVIAIPYVLRTPDPNIQAINVICRPEVPISLR